MKIIDCKDKKLTAWNKNYFYAGTIVFLVIIIAFSYIFSERITQINQINNFWNCFLQSFNPNLSMIMFAAASLYLERKFGSLKYFALCLLSMPLSNIICWSFEYLNGLSLGWAGFGFSCLAFFIFGLFIIDCLFDIKYFFKNKLEIILPIIILLIGIIFMCIVLPSEGNGFGFGFFGRLTSNPGHYGPFVIGLVIGLICKLFKIKREI